MKKEMKNLRLPPKSIQMILAKESLTSKMENVEYNEAPNFELKIGQTSTPNVFRQKPCFRNMKKNDKFLLKEQRIEATNKMFNDLKRDIKEEGLGGLKALAPLEPRKLNWLTSKQEIDKRRARSELDRKTFITVENEAP